MARGQVLHIPSGQSQLITTLDREEHSSVAILNPNDGVAYIKLNSGSGPTPTQWDWKVPSQSYGVYPGPWQSLGVYYQDLSGAAGIGDINVYDWDTQIQIPDIQAVGRAVAAAGTAVDISSGNIPQNPPPGTARLWVDSNGDLHVLSPTGSDNLVYDQSNIGTATLGGDLYGSIGAGHINLANSSQILARDAGGTTRAFVWLGNDNNTYIVNAGGVSIRLFNQAQNIELAHWDNSGNYYVAQNVFVANTIRVNNAAVNTVGDIGVNRGGEQGVLYFGSAGSHYLYFDATNYNLANGGLTVGGSTTITGNLNTSGWISGSGYYSANSSRPLITLGGETLFWDAGNGGYRWVNQGNSVEWARLNSNGFVVDVGNTTTTGTLTSGSHIYSSTGSFYPATNTSGLNGAVGWDANSGSGGSIATGAIYITPAMTAAGRVMGMQAWVGSLPGNNNCFLAPNIGDYRGSALAWAHQTWSSVDHARLYGLQVSDISDPMALVNSISGYYYAHASMKGEEPILLDTGDIESNMTYGFAASEVNANIPEMAGENWVDPSRMIAILWEAVKELDSRVIALGG